MFPELIVIRHLFAVLHGRWQALRADPEAAYSTEAVIVTALLGCAGADRGGDHRGQGRLVRQQHQYQRPVNPDRSTARPRSPPCRRRRWRSLARG